MNIGVAREHGPREHRVSLAPWGVQALVQHGHQVWVEQGAGAEAGHTDAAYEACGGRIAYSRMEVFTRAELVTGILAPSPREYEVLRPGQAVFAFWALPTLRPEEFQALLAREITAITIEGVTDARGYAPVLTSMSEIAGRLAITIGGTLLLSEYGGNGIVLAGAPGVPPANVAILGAGTLGRAAARAALGAGAEVTLLDVSIEHLRDAVNSLPGAVRTMLATRPNIERALAFADLVLGAAATRGQRAPVLVTREMLKLMKPRAVVMDFAIDMGGCFETSRPTHFPHPTYEVDGIVHFCVPNLPSCAARAATQALTNALLPYLTELAGRGIDEAIARLPELRSGTYLHRGKCVQETLARAFGVPLSAVASGQA